MVFSPSIYPLLFFFSPTTIFFFLLLSPSVIIVVVVALLFFFFFFFSSLWLSLFYFTPPLPIGPLLIPRTHEHAFYSDMSFLLALGLTESKAKETMQNAELTADLKSFVAKVRRSRT